LTRTRTWSDESELDELAAKKPHTNSCAPLLPSGSWIRHSHLSGSPSPLPRARRRTRSCSCFRSSACSRSSRASTELRSTGTLELSHAYRGTAYLLGDIIEVGRLVRSCHERYDGSGYPDGLTGDEIPLVARIVCCCDAFHAMTSDRAYRKALSQDAALAELEANSGAQFDPEVVAALTAVVGGESTCSR